MSSLDPVILSEIKKIQKAQSNPPATGDYSTIDIPIAAGSSLVPGGIGFVDRYSEEILDKFSGQITSIPSIPLVANGGGYYYPSSTSYAKAQLSNGNYLIAYQTKADTQAWVSKTIFAVIDKDTGAVLSTKTTTANTLTQVSTTTDYQKSYLEFVTCNGPDKFILFIRASTGDTAGFAVIGIVPVTITNNIITQYSTKVDCYVSGTALASAGGGFIDLINFKLINDTTLMVSCPYWGGSSMTQIRYYKFTGIFSGTINVDTTTPATTLPVSITSFFYGASISISNSRMLMGFYPSGGYVFDVDTNGILSNPITMTVTSIPGYKSLSPSNLMGYLNGAAGYLKGGSYINGVLTNAVCFTLTTTIGNKQVPAAISDVSPTGVVTVTPLIGYYEVFKEYMKLQDTKWDYGTYKAITDASKDYLTIKHPFGKFLLFNIFNKYATSVATPIACAPHICRVASFLSPYKNIGFINSVNPPLANIKGIVVDNNNYYTNIGNTYRFELDKKVLAPYNFISDGAKRYSLQIPITDDTNDSKKLTEMELSEFPAYVQISFSGSSVSGREVFIFADGICVHRALISGSPSSSTIVWEGVVGKNLLVIPGSANTAGSITNFTCYVDIFGGIPA